ncbi:MAG: helix-turn-helix transcriptional regulator [Halioglobus sp.]
MKEIATIRSAAVQPLVAGYLSQCHFAEAALNTCALSAEALDNPDSELPQFSAWKLVELLAQLEGNPLFAYDAVMQSDAILNPLSATQLLQYKDLPLELACSFIEALNIYTPQVHFWWEIVGDEFRVFSCPSDQKVREGIQVEYYALAVILRFFQAHIEDRLIPVKVTFRAQIGPTKNMPQDWGDAVQSSSRRFTAMAFPLRHFAQYAKDMAGNYSAAQQSISADETLCRFRQLVKPYIGRPGCNVDSLAAVLGLSPRTLQRRLGELETTFTSVIDDCRLEIAVEELSTGKHSKEKIAHKLGYNNPGDFTRAFKRWTGETPTGFKNVVDMRSQAADNLR